MTDLTSQSTKQQILCYILKTAPLYRQSPPSQIKEFLPSCKPQNQEEVFQSPPPKISQPLDKEQDTIQHPTDLHPTDMQVSDFMARENINLEKTVKNTMEDIVLDGDREKFYRDEDERHENSLTSTENSESYEVEKSLPEIFRKSSVKIITDDRKMEPMADSGPVYVKVPDENYKKYEMGRFTGEDTGLTPDRSKITHSTVTSYGTLTLPPVIKASDCSSGFSDRIKSTTNRKAVTMDVFTTEEFLYLIREDKREFAFANDEKTAMAIINSLANAEVKKISNPTIKVFREDLKDGKEIKVRTQTLGILVNGRVCRHVTYDIIPVPRIFITLPEPVGIPKN